MAPSTSRFAMAVSGTAFVAAVAASSAFVAAPAGQPREVSAPQLQKQLRTTGSTPSGSSSLPLTTIGLALGAAAAAASARRSQQRTTRTAGPTPAPWGADAPNRAMIPLKDLPSVAGSYEPFIPYMTPWNSEKAPELRPQDCIAGTGGPFANNYWDPAGLSKNKTRDEILQLRAQELKHGRVAMLAVLGWFHVAASWHPVGDFALGERVSDNPLISATQMSFGAHLQVIFTILCLEWLTTYVCKPPEEKPWDVIGWTDIIADEEYPPWKLAQVQELNNGRLAMVAFIGLVVGDLMFGDYGAGIAKPCFGAPVCQDLLQFLPEKNFDVYPASPFKMPPLYPRA